MKQEISPVKSLFLFDFDQTIVETFESSPNGIGVEKAYDMSVFNIFGDVGRNIYKNVLGGLQNKAPSELVQLLISSDSEDRLIKKASIFYSNNVLRLLAVLPENIKADDQEWDTRSEKLMDLLTWMLAAEKLSFLSSEIGEKLPDGQKWPRVCRGFLDFYKSIETINNQGEIKIDRGIISSGHTEFIRKTFSSIGLNLPEYLITDDNLRGVKNIPIERKTKPGPYPFALIHRQWLKDTGLSAENKSNIVYFGDDLKKDGGMAEKCRVSFGWFNKNSSIPYEISESGFLFNDWALVQKVLNERKDILVRGGSIIDVFSKNEQ